MSKSAERTTAIVNSVVRCGGWVVTMGQRGHIFGKKCTILVRDADYGEGRLRVTEQEL